jgi:hypothetical protein
MTNERKVEIINEAKRRLSLWLENSTFEEMTFYYSQIRFHMALGLIGYPFEKPEWMKDKGFDKFISKVEFDSGDYDKIISDLFDEALKHNYKI